jgi:hypothetical protein
MDNKPNIVARVKLKSYINMQGNNELNDNNETRALGVM